MLTELRTHHTTLSTLMQAMRGLIAMDELPLAAVVATRLKLTRASTARTRYINEVVVPALLAQHDSAQAADIRALITEAPELRARSSTHIANWTSETLAADWAGYRHASAGILAMMDKRIALEKTTLYPRLQKMARVMPAGVTPRAMSADLHRQR